MSLIMSIVFGGVVGTLVYYLSDVLPVTRNFSQPKCRVCNQPYTMEEYLVLHTCSHCGKNTSSRFFIILFSAMVLCILLHFFPFSNLNFYATLPILIFLGVIAVIDIEYHLVLIETTLFGVVLFLIYGIIIHGIQSTLFGALAGLLIMLSFYFIGLLFSKIIGKLRHQEIKEVAFGFGDVCFGLILGLLTGFPAIIRAITFSLLLFSAFTFALVFVLLISRRYRAYTKALPFTPFLTLGAIAVFYL